MRFFEGLGAAGAIVLHAPLPQTATQGESLELYGRDGGHSSIAPITAPMLGALIADAAGWRGIFWILFGTGVVLAFITLFVFVETLPRSRITVPNVQATVLSAKASVKALPNSLRICVLRHRVSAAPCFRHSLRTYFFVALYFPGSL